VPTHRLSLPQEQAEYRKPMEEGKGDPYEMDSTYRIRRR
jgi:hypothetical protein